METTHSAPTPPFTPITASTPPRIRKADYSISKLGDDGSTKFLRDIYRNNFPHLRAIPVDDELDKKTKKLVYRARECEKYYKYRERPMPNATKKESKWPDNWEYGFFKALLIYPPIGRKSIKCPYGKPRRGRNELIAHAVQTWTGDICGRKQVSSHLQVLKPKVANNPDILYLLGARKRCYRTTPYRSGISLRPNHQLTSSESPTPIPLQPVPRTCAPIIFAMYINHATTRSRIHIFSSLSSSASFDTIYLGETQLSDLWTPLALATGSRDPPAYPVILCEGSLTPTSQELPPGAELSIELQLSVSPGLPQNEGDKYKCCTRFYHLAQEVASYEKKIDYDSKSHRLTNLPFGSNFWASKVTQLRRQRNQETKSDDDYQVEDLKIIQIVSRISTFRRLPYAVAQNESKEILLALVWNFQLGTDQDPGITTWRRVSFETKGESPWFTNAAENADEADDDDSVDRMKVDKTEKISTRMTSGMLGGAFDPFTNTPLYTGTQSFAPYLAQPSSIDTLSLPTGLSTQFVDIYHNIQAYNQNSLVPITSSNGSSLLSSLEIPQTRHFENSYNVVKPEQTAPQLESGYALAHQQVLQFDNGGGSSTPTGIFDEVSHAPSQWHGNSRHDLYFYGDHLHQPNSQEQNQHNFEEHKLNQNGNDSQRIEYLQNVQANIENRIEAYQNDEDDICINNPQHTHDSSQSGLLASAPASQMFVLSTEKTGTSKLEVSDTPFPIYPHEHVADIGGTGGSFGIPIEEMSPPRGEATNNTELPDAQGYELTGVEAGEFSCSASDHPKQLEAYTSATMSPNVSSMPLTTAAVAAPSAPLPSNPSLISPPRLGAGTDSFPGLKAAEALQRALGLLLVDELPTNYEPKN